MKIYPIFLFLILILLAACEPPEQQQAQQEQRQQQMQMQAVETTEEFNNQMAEVLDRYFELKDALVESDSESAKASAEQLLEAVENTERAGIGEETLAMWVAYNEILSDRSAELLAEDDVDNQRYHFEYLSESMINMVETFRPVGYVIYHQSCPMVRDGSADWLSREEGIRNPYHGDRMMRCGEVIQRI